MRLKFLIEWESCSEGMLYDIEDEEIAQALIDNGTAELVKSESKTKKVVK